jgi:hypothetical protein
MPFVAIDHGHRDIGFLDLQLGELARRADRGDQPGKTRTQNDDLLHLRLKARETGIIAPR